MFFILLNTRTYTVVRESIERMKEKRCGPEMRKRISGQLLMWLKNYLVERKGMSPLTDPLFRSHASDSELMR